MNNYLSYTILIVILLLIKLVWDYYNRFKLKRIINHNRSVLIDGILYTAGAFYFFVFKGEYPWWSVIGFVMMAGAFRWIIFDPAFSLLSGTGFHHHGESSSLDRWLLQVGKGHFFVKLIPLVLGLLIILLSRWIK